MSFLKEKKTFKTDLRLYELSALAIQSKFIHKNKQNSVGVPTNSITRPFRPGMDIKGNPAVNLKKYDVGFPQIFIPDPSGLVLILRGTPPQILKKWRGVPPKIHIKPPIRARNLAGRRKEGGMRERPPS